MPLRKSPRRTQALLAANRRNSRKSTGPRTFEGKWHSSGNAIRHYRRTQFASCVPIENRESGAFEDFLSKLREAIIPADNAKGTETLLLKAAEVWRVKRSFDRWIETRTEEDWLVLAAGAVPRPHSWRLKLRRPGLSVPDWVVTASVCLRWGRGPGRSRRSTAKDHEKPDRLRMHTIVSVHSTGPFRPAEVPEGPASEPECERTKPESPTIQGGSKNMSVPADWDPDYAAAYALAERIVGCLLGWGKRTKPESHRNQEACKNMSPAGEPGGRNPNGGGGATGLGRVFRTVKTALAPRKEWSQLPLFQTKPECSRKEGAYKNMPNGMSKIGGWLGAAASFLLRRDRGQSCEGATRPPHPNSSLKTRPPISWCSRYS
jgi:hypothetical protein